MSNNYSGLAGVTVSIVSHHHGDMVESLLSDMQSFPEIAQVIITINVPENLPIIPPTLSDKIIFIRNNLPRGFGANHNAAFLSAKSPYFCVLNPDVRLPTNPFSTLLSALQDKSVGVVAPAVVTQDGQREDNTRFFPTPKRLLNKILSGDRGVYSNPNASDHYTPDWVAGMFMLFSKKTFDLLHGFDERYFLYYEDADICTRVWKEGLMVMAFDSVSIVHQAQRTSHKRLKFTLWHLSSMLRYFSTHLLSLPKSSTR